MGKRRRRPDHNYPCFHHLFSHVSTGGRPRDLILIVLGALFGAARGSKRGALSFATYLVMGTVGLPLFAGGANGWNIVIGATGGYLVGFVVAAYVIGLLAERGLEQRVRTSLIPFLAGTLIIYICGVAWLAIVLGSFGNALAAGLIPFLIGDAIKLVAPTLVLPAAWKFVR